MIPSFSLGVPPPSAGQRLDLFVLRHLPTCSRAEIQAAIADGRVCRNGRTTSKGAKIEVDDHVAGRDLLEIEDYRIQPNPDLQLQVLAETADWVACDKPAGLPTHPLHPRERETLASALVARYPEIARLGEPPLMGGILHRLDTDTSGLVLAARHTAAYACLRAQFTAHQVAKTYLALVAGGVTRGGELTHLLAHQPGQRGRMVDANSLRSPDRAMRAVTAFEPLARHGGFTLLEVTILTGVTHQIRCQLALAGLPLAGDRLYGGPILDWLTRQFLHACRVVFADPADGTSRSIDCPLPSDLRAVLERLGS